MKLDAYEAIKGRFLSREWRLDNLYFIQNAKGARSSALCAMNPSAHFGTTLGRPK